MVHEGEDGGLGTAHLQGGHCKEDVRGGGGGGGGWVEGEGEGEGEGEEGEWGLGWEGEIGVGVEVGGEMEGGVAVEGG